MSEHNTENLNNGFSFDDDEKIFESYSMPYSSQDTDSSEDKNMTENKTNSNSKLLKGIFEALDVFVAAMVVVVIVFTFVFRTVAIDGDSMLNTLHDGERIIISDLFYEPKRGDIVVISRNTDNSADSSQYKMPIIKRVIATEGETVDIDFEKGIVYVNGTPLEEDYILEPTYRKLDVDFPVMVPENCVFVLGDNRNNSTDSRSSSIGENGMINEKYILGRAVLRVLPINKFGRID